VKGTEIIVQFITAAYRSI